MPLSAAVRALTADEFARAAGATWSQRHVLETLILVTDDGWPATVREVTRAAGYASPSTTQYHLIALERLGLVRRHPRNQAGGWRPTERRPPGGLD